MKFRLYPTPAQETVLAEYIDHTKWLWNIALEQRNYWDRERLGRKGWKKRPTHPLTGRHHGKTYSWDRSPSAWMAVAGPGSRVTPSAQLTELRDAFPKYAAYPCAIQQQTLRDLDKAYKAAFSKTNPAKFPRWKNRKDLEGSFNVTKVSYETTFLCQSPTDRVGFVKVPKMSPVMFRTSGDPGKDGAALQGAKSFRVSRDGAGRWWMSIPWVPPTTDGPGDGSVVGVDMGVTDTVSLSTGETLRMPTLPEPKLRRKARLERQLARQRRMGEQERKKAWRSNRYARTLVLLNRLRAEDRALRKEWIETTTTMLARRFDVIVLEDLKVRNMTRSAKGTVDEPGVNVRAKAGLNREILRSCFGEFRVRLEQKAAARVRVVNPAFTSQTCSECGAVDRASRRGKRFECVGCGWVGDADVNAAVNIARIGSGSGVGGVV